MKQISTGTGLVVLSGTMLASVFLSSPRTATTAFASAQQAQPAERGVRRKTDSAAPVAMTAGCESQIWFNPQPHEFLSGCSDVVALPITPVDVNRDGFQEIILANVQLLASGVPVAPIEFGSSLEVSWVDIAPEGVSPRKSNVLQLGHELVNVYISQLPDLGDINYEWWWTISANPGGWLDCDSDGDLDFVLEIHVMRHVGPFFTTIIIHKLWFENTGFQHTAPIEGDLNHDGQVDNADVGVLLLNFDA